LQALSSLKAVDGIDVLCGSHFLLEKHQRRWRLTAENHYSLLGISARSDGIKYIAQQHAIEDRPINTSDAWVGSRVLSTAGAVTPVAAESRPGRRTAEQLYVAKAESNFMNYNYRWHRMDEHH